MGRQQRLRKCHWRQQRLPRVEANSGSSCRTAQLDITKPAAACSPKAATASKQLRPQRFVNIFSSLGGGMVGAGEGGGMKGGLAGWWERAETIGSGLSALRISRTQK